VPAHRLKRGAQRFAVVDEQHHVEGRRRRLDFHHFACDAVFAQDEIGDREAGHRRVTAIEHADVDAARARFAGGRALLLRCGDADSQACEPERENRLHHVREPPEDRV
jgi:hypothetical protein